MSEELKKSWGAEKYEKFRAYIKEAIVKFSAMPVGAEPPSTEPPENPSITVSTLDGKTLSVSGDAMTPGALVNEVTGDTMSAPQPADGTYTLQDGSTLVAIAGKIDSVTPAAAPAMPEEFKAEFAALKKDRADILKFRSDFEAKFKAQEKEIIELKSTVRDMVTCNKELLEFADFMSKEPVQEPAKVKINPEEMTEFQKYQMEKYGEVKY